MKMCTMCVVPEIIEYYKGGALFACLHALEMIRLLLPFFYYQTDFYLIN